MVMRHKGSLSISKDLTVDNGITVVSGMNIAGLEYPTSDGSANQVIETDGSGNLTFVAQTGGSALTVEEVDGNPSVGSVDTIRFSNGTLTDDGGGQVTIDNSGGGVDSISGLVGDVTVSGFGEVVVTLEGQAIVVSGTAHSAGGDQLQNTLYGQAFVA